MIVQVGFYFFFLEFNMIKISRFKNVFLYMFKKKRLISFLIIFYSGIYAQTPPSLESSNAHIRSTELTQKFLTPTRIVWKSDNTGTMVVNAESILKPGIGQADLNQGKYLVLENDKDSKSGIIIDFGIQIQGGIEIVTTINNNNPVGNIRLRFGESVGETMSEVGDDGATNDHAMRDFNLQLPWLGRTIAGETGFRFVRIDLIDPETKIEIKEISAVFRYRDIPYLGSFTCDDEQLNKIWMTGAYTVPFKHAGLFVGRYQKG